MGLLDRLFGRRGRGTGGRDDSWQYNQPQSPPPDQGGAQGEPHNHGGQEGSGQQDQAQAQQDQQAQDAQGGWDAQGGFDTGGGDSARRVAAVGATEAEAEAAISRWSLRRRKRGAEGDADSGHGRADALIVGARQPRRPVRRHPPQPRLRGGVGTLPPLGHAQPRKRYGGLIAEGRTGMGGARVAILSPRPT